MDLHEDTYMAWNKQAHTPITCGWRVLRKAFLAMQRRYEALRAYLYEGLSAADAAARFGYKVQSLSSAVRDFRAGHRDFFIVTKPGRKSAPTKAAARLRVIELRRAGHSAYEIAEALSETDTPLNRTEWQRSSVRRASLACGHVRLQLAVSHGARSHSGQACSTSQRCPSARKRASQDCS